MKNKTYYVMAAVAALFASAGYGRDHYINDFATRTSVKPMPGGQWYSTDYVYPASLCYSYSEPADACTPLSPYGDLSKVQDGWTFSVASTNRGKVEFWARTDPDSDNPFGCFSRIGTYVDQQVMAIQPLYNAFSNGTLRLSVDVRAPSRVYGGYDGAFLRIGLACSNVLAADATTYGNFPLVVGFSEDCKYLTPVGTDGYGNSRYGAQISFDRANWYRLVTDINLDSNTYSWSAYDMGSDQPSLSTPTPSTAIGTATDNTWPLTAATGPVTGLAIRMRRSTRYSLTDSYVDTTNCPCVDNFRIWWNASSASTSFGDSDLFYENDFSTRRVRTLASGSKAATYSGELAETDAETYVFWDVATKAVPGSSANLTTSATAGRDGWRKVDAYCHNANVVATGEDGGNVLAVVRRTGQSDYYFKAYHPIGTTVSDGLLKFEYDFRTPSEWMVGSQGYKYFDIFIGGDGVRSNGGAPLVRTGFSANGDLKFYPSVYRSGTREVQSANELSALTWYRVSIVADLMKSTYDYSIYELGAKSGPLDRDIPAEPFLSLVGIPFNPSASGPITTFALYDYDFGDTFAKAQLLDNVRVWTGSDGSNWSLVYQNDFNKRIRYGLPTVQEAKLLDDGVNRPGLDFWMRRGAGDAAMFLRNAMNPFATVEGEGSFAHAVHTLGKPVTKGKVVVRADIRPPSRVSNRIPHAAAIYIGGDAYAQGEVGTAEGVRTFTDVAAGCFGFAGNTGDVTALGYCRTQKIVVEDSNGAQAWASTLSGDALLKWYRFVATFDLDTKTWNLDVYNQGTTRPAFDDANGSAVVSFTNLEFKHVDPTGFTAIGIEAGGSSGSDADPRAVDKKGVLIDNISVVGDEQGFILSFK